MYAGLLGNANSAPKLVMLIIEPSFTLAKDGVKHSIHRYGAVRFTSIVLSESSLG